MFEYKICLLFTEIDACDLCAEIVFVTFFFFFCPINFSQLIIFLLITNKNFSSIADSTSQIVPAGRGVQLPHIPCSLPKDEYGVKGWF